MLTIEARTSQAFVRNYFTDIPDPVLFYGINTSLSSTLLYTTFLMLSFAAFADVRRWDRQASLFLTQGVFCLYMALDDRFRFHERLADWSGVHDPFIMGPISLLLIAVYATLFRPWMFNPRMAIALTMAAAFFFVMTVLDVLAPHDMFMRLSLEDLAKTWSAFMFALMGWEGARYRLLGMPVGEQGLVLPSRLLLPWWRTAREQPPQVRHARHRHA